MVVVDVDPEVVFVGFRIHPYRHIRVAGVFRLGGILMLGEFPDGVLVSVALEEHLELLDVSIYQQVAGTDLFEQRFYLYPGCRQRVDVRHLLYEMGKKILGLFFDLFEVFVFRDLAYFIGAEPDDGAHDVFLELACD